MNAIVATVTHHDAAIHGFTDAVRIVHSPHVFAIVSNHTFVAQCSVVDLLDESTSNRENEKGLQTL